MNWFDLFRAGAVIVVIGLVCVQLVLVIALRRQLKERGAEMARVDWLIRTQTVTAVHKGVWGLVRAGMLVSVVPADASKLTDLRAVIDATMESENG